MPKCSFYGSMIRLLSVVLALALTGCFHRHGDDSAAKGAQSASPYHRPLTSLGTLFGILPPPAQNTVRAQAGSAEIVNVEKGATADRVYYKVYFRESEHYPPLYVGADGSVLNSDLTVAMQAPRDIGGSLNPSGSAIVTTNDLPPTVVKEIRTRSQNAEINQIKREIWGNHVVYIVWFKDEAQHPVLYLPADIAPSSAAPK
jgi:hypothetical protein